MRLSRLLFCLTFDRMAAIKWRLWYIYSRVLWGGGVGNISYTMCSVSSETAASGGCEGWANGSLTISFSKSFKDRQPQKERSNCGHS